jgi:replication factor C small subunit|tara:strand:- start:205 stop:1077 length:873 start_codon:yes stop_codon:yes gene_type:complete
MMLEEMIHDESHPLNEIKSMISAGEVPDLLLVGPPGTGKTTTAHAIARALNADLHEFNTSDERGIDFIRTRVKELATQRGYGEATIILLDEADGLTKQAQDALRRIMETGHALFILTANEGANITPAISSRCHTCVFRAYNSGEVMSLLKRRYHQISEEVAVAVCAAWNGDLREITRATNMSGSVHDLMVKAGAAAEAYSAPALSIVGGDWVALRQELIALSGVAGQSNLSILNRLHDRVRQLDMEPARFHHYSRVWGDAVLATHQWPLGREGFIDWFVGSLASQWERKK